YFRARTGIVPQNDLVYLNLTVEENLRYAAQLRRPHLDSEKLNDLLQDTLAVVELTDHADKLAVVLSGGQRKRLSVAIELLTRPRLLILDEPTSGLDPGLQARLMDLLRKLAKQGLTVVCATHTLDTLHYFDRLVVIGLESGVGRVAYTGPPAGLLAAFGVRNSPDLFGCLQNLNQSLRVESEPALEPGCSTEHPTATRDTPGVGLAIQRSRSPQARLWDQFAIVLIRSLLGCWRDRPALVFLSIQPIILAALTALSTHEQGRSAFIHFFLVISILWMGMTLTVREIVRERALYVRDRLAGLAPDMFLAGKLVYASVLIAAQSLVLCFTARMLAEPIMTGGGSGMVWDEFRGVSISRLLFGCFAAGLGGVLIGLLLSTLSRTQRMAVSLLPLVLLPQVMLSRVAFGDRTNLWSDPSPVGRIISVGDYLKPDEYNAPGVVVLLASLPMVSCPATALIDMPFTRPGAKASFSAAIPIVAEGIYLCILLLAYASVLYAVFRHQEKGWSIAERTE
ncbi:MAG: ABC transporter ATP-binding protein, partial [Anaerolineales bacterium]|nr:ABC transporter ATP-binding protein [Anaerolineales bacterium]